MRISDWSSDVCSSDLLVDRLVDRTGIADTGRNRLRGGRMAAGVTERLQIVAGGDAGLLHPAVRKQMAAGRVDVAEAEAPAAQIGKRANGALLARHDQRLNAIQDIALNERSTERA